MPDADEIRDIYCARAMLEVGAICRARAGADLDHVRAAVTDGKQARDSGDSAGVAAANQHFHRAIVSLAGSHRLDRLMAQMLAEMRLVFHAARSNPSFYQDFVDENEAIYELLERGQPADAAKAMEEYLRRSQSKVLLAAGG